VNSGIVCLATYAGVDKVLNPCRRGNHTSVPQKGWLTMEILTKEEARALLGGGSLDTVLSDWASRLRRVGDTYAIPVDSGRKTALARLLSNLFLRDCSVLLYVSGWGVWPSSENLDLFYGYRRSSGERRTLREAPAHLFEPTDVDTFVSVLSMVLFFLWDAWISDVEGKTLVRVSHDEWFEVFTGDDASNMEFAAELGNYGLPPVGL
jgi:hypothetical protein